MNFLSFIRKRKAQFAVFNFGARDHAFVLAVFGISRPTDMIDALACGASMPGQRLPSLHIFKVSP
jgi:hypothetical protein